MIFLENEIVSIKINPENPIYETLKRFSGESLKVRFDEQKTTPTEFLPEEKTPEPKTSKTPSYVRKEVNRESIWEDFNQAFSQYLDPQSLFGSIIKSHLQAILQGDEGDVVLNEVSPGLFKRDGLYLLFRKT